jgi:formate/nitrite transporter FocA (FNT family)
MFLDQTGDGITVADMANNLVPVVAGNFVGAAVFVGGIHYYLHMRKRL